MSILKHLISYDFLAESPEIPVELKKLFAAGVSQNFRGKALEKLWGGKRLSWNGDKFFADNKLGPAYEKAEQAAVAYMDDGYNTDVQIELHGKDDASHDFQFDIEFGHDRGADHQECYLGYDPHSDKLYIGFDVWVSEENFNSDFDPAFKELTGEEYDSDDEEHHKIFNEAWQEYQSGGWGFWGLVFEISHDTGEYKAEEAFQPLPGGFYKGMYKMFKANHKNVVDLRLN